MRFEERETPMIEVLAIVGYHAFAVALGVAPGIIGFGIIFYAAGKE